MKNQRIGVGSLLLATFLYGFFAILTRTIGFNLPIFFQNWTRSLIELILVSPLLLLFKKWTKVKVKDFKWMLIRSVGGLFGFYGSYIAFLFIPIGTTYFVFYAGSTIGGYLIGKLLFKEKLNRIKIISLFLAFLGLIFIYLINFEGGKSLYIFLALISGLGTAIWNTFSKKISRRYSALQLNFIDVFLVFIITFLFSLFVKEHWILPNLSSVWMANGLFALMFFSTGLLIIYGFKYVEAQIGSLIMLAEVVFGVFLGLIFYKEIISFTTLLGGIAIITAIILPEVYRKKTKNFVI